MATSFDELLRADLYIFLLTRRAPGWVQEKPNNGCRLRTISSASVRRAQPRLVAVYTDNARQVMLHSLPRAYTY
jgi:hypothetical protein